MRVLVLSWDGRARDEVSALAAAGNEVHVLTRSVGAPRATPWRSPRGARIHQVPERPPLVPFYDPLAWVLQYAFGFVETGLKILHDERIDVVHAFDWQMAYPAAILRDLCEVAVVATLSGTEMTRRRERLSTEPQRLVHQMEWWLTYLARRVVVATPGERDNLVQNFELPADKIDLIERCHPGVRRDVLFAGWCGYRTDALCAFGAARALAAIRPEARFLVTADGPFAPMLRRLANRCAIADRLEFRFDIGATWPDLAAGVSVVAAPGLTPALRSISRDALSLRIPLVVNDFGGDNELSGYVESPAPSPGDTDALVRTIDNALGSDASATETGPESDSLARSLVAIYRKAAEGELAFRSANSEHPPLRLIWDESAAFRRAGGLGG